MNINLTNTAKVEIKVVKVEGGWRVESTLTNTAPVQNSTAYGKIYKSQKRAEKQAAEWIAYQLAA